MTGMSLHQRGYRLQAGLAPLKETVAAAMLVRMQWPQLLKEGYALLDPCCGSGTLLIEAMMMSANIAPGLLQNQKAFFHWKGYSDKTWKALCIEAQQRQCVPEVLAVGSDEDARVLDFARSNALRAGVSDWIEWREESIAVIRPSQSKGLVISNPPYGVRLEDEAQLVPLYRQLGEVLHTYFQGWQAGVLTSNLALAKAIGLRAHKQYTLYNGSLECKLVCIPLTPTNQLKTLIAPITVTAETLDAPDVQMFANRLEKNQIKLKKWAKLNHMDCYRVYDADLPDYAFAIDCYQDYAVVQEYAAPALIDVAKVERRRVSALAVIPRILNIPPDHLIFKQRRAQKGKQQYEKLSQAQLTLTVREGRARLRVNLTDYLDTGLFLDHRPLRLLFENLAPGTRFLNCFCYTASASVHAALAGAITVNVDLSNTYLEWAETNFKLNQLDLSKHQFVQYDCLTWLQVT
ncbi:MAG: 23S rRNA (guanine(2445)-N(2))/(guanine(2069)-N(7))-methyltransferase, partial [Legionella sp. 21-45-4]